VWERLRVFVVSGRILILAPLLLLVTLVAWAFASPVGSSPDEDYHLASIWCATGDDAACVHEPGDSKATVPGALVDAACYAFHSERSGECQHELDFTGSPDTATDRGNFYGAYPPVFYSVLSVFVGPDIQLSVLLMRVFVSFVFVSIATALFLLLPPPRRSTLVWSWALTTVPLGLFVIASINPSAWAVAGVGFGWLALAGFLETRGARKIGLGVIFALSVVMASGSRGDASMYMVLAIVATLILQAHRSRRFALDAILPAAGIILCLLMFRVSRPTEAITQGVDDSGFAFGRILPTMLDVPRLWMGIFGKGWGLGWLDTSMPSIVWLATLSCFLGAGVVAGFRSDLRKGIVLAGGLLVLLVFPTLVLVAAGQDVGDNLQPRYLLPLVVLFAGVLFWQPPGRVIRFGRVQRGLVIAALSVAQAVALFLQLARYVTGFDDLTPWLDGGVEWWWPVAPSPMTVWVLGSLAYAALLVLLLARPLAVADAVEAPVDEPVGAVRAS
jgi:hypothetical protein